MQELNTITELELKQMRTLRETQPERWLAQFARTFYNLAYEQFNYVYESNTMSKNASFIINGVKYKNLKDAHSRSPFCNMTIRKAVVINKVPKGSEVIELYIPDKLATRTTELKDSKLTLKAVKVSINGVVYDSIKTAAKELGLGYYVVRSRIQSGDYPEYVMIG